MKKNPTSQDTPDTTAASPSPAERPDPELLKKDPMAELFGPGSGTKLLGEANDEIPDEIRGVLEEYGLSKLGFQCTLKEIPEGSTIGDHGASTNTKYIKSWNRSIPSMEYIAKNWGPGQYLLQFSWRIRDESTNNESKAMHTEVTVEVSQKYYNEYKKHRLDQRINEAKEMGTRVQEELVERKLEHAALKGVLGEEKPSAQQSPKEYLNEIMDTVRSLGLPVGLPAPLPQNKIEWEKLLPPIITGLTAFMQMQQSAAQARESQFDKILMLLMTQNQHSSTQLVEIMKAQSGQGNANNAIKEFKDMLFSVVDLKEALQGRQESLGDKIFRVIEGVAPQIMSIAATAAEAQAAKNNPLVKAAKSYVNSNPDFIALKNNPMELKKTYEKMDDFFGWKQTDVIAAVVGWERPPECPRDPTKEEPPQIVEDTVVEDTSPTGTQLEGEDNT